MTTVERVKGRPYVWQAAVPDRVYIGRPSKWGNPFEIGRDGTREEVIETAPGFWFTPNFSLKPKSYATTSRCVCTGRRWRRSQHKNYCRTNMRLRIQVGAGRRLHRAALDAARPKEA